MTARVELNRAEWGALCDEMQTGPKEDVVRAEVRPDGGGGTLEFGDISVVTAYATRGATDIRIGNLQVLVSRDRLVVVRSDGPYPISKWTVLYDAQPFIEAEW